MGTYLFFLKVTDIFNTERDKNISYYKDFDFNFLSEMANKGFLLSVQYTLDNKNKLKSGTVKSDNDNREIIKIRIIFHLRYSIGAHIKF